MKSESPYLRQQKDKNNQIKTTINKGDMDDLSY